MYQHDVADLRDFYASGLGQVVRRLLGRRLRAYWPRVSGACVMGLGFATPYLGAFRSEAACVGALMPATQGALVWPPSGPHLALLVEEERLPLPDNTVDRLIVVHSLEVSPHPRALLREVWRVLAPQGRAIFIVPSRSGLWARLDTTPFGQGRPFSRGQLDTLLKEALFTPMEWSGSLFIPPFDRRMLLRAAPTAERFGSKLAPRLAGIILVEAGKELAAPIGKTTARVLRPVAVPALGFRARGTVGGRFRDDGAA